MTTAYQEAVLKHRRAGGTWPPKPAGPRWSGSGRWRPLPRWSAPIRCGECGHEAGPSSATCALCGAAL